MSIAEKQSLRNFKLKELYDFNEQNAGREASINFEDLYTNETDKNEHLAYEYLEEKGLINYKIQARNMYSAKITAYGIDYVEENLV